jgi:hypothetical protein
MSRDKYLQDHTIEVVTDNKIELKSLGDVNLNAYQDVNIDSEAGGIQMATTNGAIDISANSNLTLSGLTATISAADGIALATGVKKNAGLLRYPYLSSDPLDIEFDFSPDLGGWTLFQDGNQIDLLFQLSGSGVTILNTDAINSRDVDARRPIPFIINPEADISAVRYKIVSMTTIADASYTDIELVRITRSSGSELVLLTCNGSQTNNNSGTPINVNTFVYRYCVRIKQTLVPSGVTDAIRSIIVKVRKYSVE